MAEFVYPTIEGPTFAFFDTPCLAFEKYDGSNLRFFYDQRRGWHSTGTRYRWFKAVTPMFGPAVEMFQSRYAQGIVEILRGFKEYRGVTELVAFCEFFGPSTFSGLHKEDEPKQLVLFDVYLPGRGFVPPRLRHPLRTSVHRQGSVRRPVQPGLHRRGPGGEISCV